MAYQSRNKTTCSKDLQSFNLDLLNVSDYILRMKLYINPMTLLLFNVYSIFMTFCNWKSSINKFVKTDLLTIIITNESKSFYVENPFTCYLKKKIWAIVLGRHKSRGFWLIFDKNDVVHIFHKMVLDLHKFYRILWLLLCYFESDMAHNELFLCFCYKKSTCVILMITLYHCTRLMHITIG